MNDRVTTLKVKKFGFILLLCLGLSLVAYGSWELAILVNKQLPQRPEIPVNQILMVQNHKLYFNSSIKNFLFRGEGSEIVLYGVKEAFVNASTFLGATLRIEKCERIIVNRVLIDSNSDYGIYVKDSKNVILNNYYIGNANIGILIESSSEIMVDAIGEEQDRSKIVGYDKHPIKIIDSEKVAVVNLPD